ncbi:hypothetical protein [Marinibactrum halimedae]|uniref:Uncharacterized protein n=1 Tax=Marinibactrum halimedae TaxID=1444977 RepID=A0AA37WNR6_9GAMM|nr:hypothetical protein [Marinibactrum halimedae]MCD9460614.1 hypothetical protein [Marinibactrum halimedae]GLS27830.1 hypothetical protein GCM10007877_35490 [Marinibactrum halimedae]
MTTKVLATAGYRYGGKGEINEKNLNEQVKKLVEQLRQEEFDTPDDEHTQVFITRPDDMSLTGYVDGLLKLEHLTDFSIQPLYCCADTADEMHCFFEQFIQQTLKYEMLTSWSGSHHVLSLPGKEFRIYPAN